MTDDTLLPFDLPAVHRKKLTIDFNGGTQSSDGGLLLLREAERKLGVCRRLAAAMPDRRERRGIVPRPAAAKADQPPNALHGEWTRADQLVGAVVRARAKQLRKYLA